MHRLQGMSFQRLLIIPLFLGVIASMPATAKNQEALGRSATPEVRRARTSGGTYLVEIRSAEPIPLNEIFGLEFRVFDGASPDELVKNVRITINTWMPAHQHSGSLAPQIYYRDDGSAWGEGLLFHMEGLWELRIGVMANGLMERVVFDIDMEP